MSKTCKYCGNVLNDGDNFCQKCGAVAESEPEVVQTPPTQNTQQVNNNYQQTSYSAPAGKNCGTAVAAMVCSIVGVFVCGVVLGILGICLGASGLNHIKNFPNEKGRGMAITGIVLGAIDVVLAIFSAIILVGLGSL